MRRQQVQNVCSTCMQVSAFKDFYSSKIFVIMQQLMMLPRLKVEIRINLVIDPRLLISKTEDTS